MSDGGIRPDINLRIANYCREFRPIELAVVTHDVTAAPNLVEINGIACSAARDNAETTLTQGKCELAPSVCIVQRL
jgi:hypothetical protein